jgi:hypothetical protein
MPMTYEESATLINDPVFRGRVGVACVTYARYISDEATNTPAHSTRLRWASQTMTNPEMAVQQVTPTVVMDAAVQDAGGAAVTDQALQGAVELAVNKLL